MPKTWTTEIEEMLEVEPDWDDELVPRCSEHCPQYDGKRCRLLGQRPGAICEPAVAEMAGLLNRRTPV